MRSARLWLMIASVALLMLFGGATALSGAVLWLAFEDVPGWQRKSGEATLAEEMSGYGRRRQSVGNESRVYSGGSEDSAAGAEQEFLGLSKSEWKDVHLVVAIAAVMATALHVAVNLAWLKGAARYVLSSLRLGR